MSRLRWKTWSREERFVRRSEGADLYATRGGACPRWLGGVARYPEELWRPWYAHLRETDLPRQHRRRCDAKLAVELAVASTPFLRDSNYRHPRTIAPDWARFSRSFTWWRATDATPRLPTHQSRSTP